MQAARPFYRNPKVQTLLVVLAALALYLYLTSKLPDAFPNQKDLIKTIYYLLTLQFGRIPESVRVLAFDGFLCFFGMFLWIAFFAQFVLPLRTLRDRYLATERLTLYLTQEHGPAIYVENGIAKERKEENRKKGPGVVLLDTASGALLRNDFEFTRPAGPGVVFTEKYEYLAKSVDLHTHSVRLGPNDEDRPFAPLNPDEDDETEYQGVQERRAQTQALTRDGVEVVPNVGVAYRLKRPPDGNPYSFGYNPASVRLWVTADGPVSTNASEKEAQRWDDIPLEQLPAYMAVELWREYLQKFTLGELFAPPFSQPPAEETAFPGIAQKVNERMTQPTVQELDANGKPTQRRRPSREFLALEERGIHVLGAGISNLRFEPSVENRLVQGWIATWLQSAQQERARVEARRSDTTVTGRLDALERFARTAIQGVNLELLDLPRPVDERDEQVQMALILERLVEGTRAESMEPQFVQMLQTDESNLRDLLAWIGGQGL